MSNPISIFAKTWSYGKTKMLSKDHLIRGSSLIRGEQISSYLGCKYNPMRDYENDVCIYVKPVPDLNHVKDGSWVDIMDADHTVEWLKERPKVNAVAFSEVTFARYRARMKNKMVLIPQHHCNYNRELRTRKIINTVGFIGGEVGFNYPEEDMRKLIEKEGFNFLFLSDYKTREQVIDFYKKIDIQLVWCHPKPQKQAKAPLKLANSASFGIPTIAYPQACYIEAEGYYIKITNLDKLSDELKKLKEPNCYNAWTKWIIPWSEGYHISKIAELYRKLECC